MAGKTARAKGRQTTLVREASKRVGLVHELRELRGAVELLDGGHDRADVDQALRRDVIGVLACHALANDALHTAHANTELVLHQLAHRADATVAKVVDVVELLGGVALMQRNEVTQGADDVLAGKDLLVEGDVKAKLLVDLVTTNAGEVVALVVEVEAVDERTGGVDGGRLARTLTTVDLDQGVLTRGGNVALERGANNVAVAQKVHDLVVGLGDAKGTQQDRCALTTLAVDGDHEVAVLVDLKLEPGTTGRNELDMVDLNAVVHLRGEVHTRRAHELRDHNALGAVDHKGAALGHKREIAHEDELLLDLAGLLVDKAHVNKERSLVRDVLGTALSNSAGRITKLVLAKGDLHSACGVLDGREFGKRLCEAVGHEALKRLLLDRNEIWELHSSWNLAEAHALALRIWGRHCGRHRAFPP